jgi:ABC-type glycerol-3-phosphate transport system substrate-binding protein
MPFSRRRLLAGSLAAGAVLAACGEPDLVELPDGFAGDADPTPPSALAVDVAVKPAGNVAVTVGVASGHAKLADFEILIHSAVADVEAATPDLDLDVIQVRMGTDLADFTGAFVNSVESVLDRGQTLDLLVLPDRPALLALAGAELIADIEPFLAGGRPEPRLPHPLALQATSINGKRWANAWGITPQALWYQPELFDNVGLEPPPPAGWDWDEFLEAALKLTVPAAADGSGGQWGFWSNELASLPFIWQNGGSILSDDGSRSSLDQPEAIGALRFLADLTHVHRVAPSRVDIAKRGTDKKGYRILVGGLPVALTPGEAVLRGGYALSQLGVKIAPMMRGRQSANRGSVNGMLAIMAGSRDPAAAFYAAGLIEAGLAVHSPFPARAAAIADIMALSLGLTEYEAGVVASSLADARDFIHPLSNQILAIVAEDIETPLVTANTDPEKIAVEAAETIDQLLAAS